MTGPIQVMEIIKTKTNDTIVLIGIGVSRRESMSINDMESSGGRRFLFLNLPDIRIVVCNGMKRLESCEFVSSENSSNSIRLRVNGMTPTLSLIELIEA